jgi:hypothetical protein
MKTWSIRFRGSDERETLARADLFFLENKDAIGLAREEFFARLLVSEDGRQASFLSTREPLWNQRPAFGDEVVGTEPAVGAGLEAEEPTFQGAGSGPESAAEEDAL